MLTMIQQRLHCLCVDSIAEQGILATVCAMSVVSEFAGRRGCDFFEETVSKVMICCSAMMIIDTVIGKIFLERLIFDL